MNAHIQCIVCTSPIHRFTLKAVSYCQYVDEDIKWCLPLIVGSSCHPFERQRWAVMSKSCCHRKTMRTHSVTHTQYERQQQHGWQKLCYWTFSCARKWKKKPAATISVDLSGGRRWGRNVFLPSIFFNERNGYAKVSSIRRMAVNWICVYLHLVLTKIRVFHKVAVYNFCFVTWCCHHQFHSTCEKLRCFILLLAENTELIRKYKSSHNWLSALL